MTFSDKVTPIARSVYDPDLFDRQLDQLLARLGISGPIDLVGHSMGGLIAATYAARRRERISSLTLIAPAGVEMRMHWIVRMVQRPIIGEYLFRVFGRQLARRHSQLELECLELKGSRRPCSPPCETCRGVMRMHSRESAGSNSPCSRCSAGETERVRPQRPRGSSDGSRMRRSISSMMRHTDCWMDTRTRSVSGSRRS
jgi:pimeloyl-ACP methyl ester carboxylesterase